MVEHTYDVLAQLDGIGSQVDQYVNISRVFVLTGTEDFLGPLEDLRPQIADEMASLELLVADNPEQLARLIQLGPPVARRLDMSDNYIAIRRRSALAEAVEEIPEGGESLAAEIRERISEMAMVETQLLGQRRAEAAASDTAALVTVSFAGLSGLGVLALTVAALRRQTIERLRAEKSLRTSEERLRFVIRGTNDGVWDWNIDTGEQYTSPRWKELLGYPEAEFSDPVSMFFDTVHPDERPAMDAALKSHFEEDTPYSVEIRAQHKDGGYRWMLMRGEALRDAIGKPVRMVGALADITERKQAEEQLRQAQKMEAVGQLTGGVAHDFNNILTSVIGNLELLKETGRDRPDIQGFVEAALRSSNRAATLTRQLLAFSRKQALSPVPLDINELVGTMTQLLRSTLGENIEIETIRGPKLRKALVDGGQLETSLLNLALNARDAMPEAGKLAIETANVTIDWDHAEGEIDMTPGSYVMVAVGDTGVGMTPEVVNEAFQPFFTTKEPGKGSGLGLSMVYGFVKQSGGHVAIDSEVGRGTTVKLYLPHAVAEWAAVQHPTTEKASQASGGALILVVEDDPDVREFLELALGTLGYAVVSCEDGPSALAKLEELHTVDLLLTDVVLPGGMTGKEVADRVSSIRPNIPILFSSGYTENSVVHDGKLDAGVKLLEKPYKREKLARYVREALDKKR